MAAREIALGSLTLQPGRQLLADGQPVPIGRKSLDLLSALAGAGGDLVTKDELMEAVWPGQIVEENAIQAHVAALRKALGPEAERLKTVRGLGYRLTLGGESPLRPREGNGHVQALVPSIGTLPGKPSADEILPPPRRASNPRRLAISALVLLALAAALLLYLRPWARADMLRIGIVAQAGPQAEPLARRLAADLARLASARAGDLAVAQSDDGLADYIVSVGTHRAGDGIGLDVSLASRRHSELLWSASFEPSDGAEANLRGRAAARLGAVLLCAAQRPEQLHALDLASTRLFLNACDRARDRADEVALANLRKLAERAPHFAPGLALLAMAEADLTRYWLFSTPEEEISGQRQALRRAARDHLLAARALDPSLGGTYRAEAELLRPDQWAERLLTYERGLAVDPGNADLHASYSFALFSVGRVASALESAQRAAALDPLSPQSRNSLISALAYGGRHDDARRELEQAERLWPGSSVIGDARYRFELRYGDPDAAMRLFGRHQPQAGPVDQNQARARALMEARIDPTPANIARALLLLRQGKAEPSDVSHFYFSALAQFGRLDEAYRLLERPEWLAVLRQQTEVYFRDYTWPMRQDRRFMALAARIGLLQFWQSSGHWPDFCRDTRLAYECRQEARRLLAPGSPGHPVD